MERERERDNLAGTPCSLATDFSEVLSFEIMPHGYFLFVAQSHSCCSPDSPSSQDGQPVPGNPDYHHRPQSHAAGGPADAADAGYFLNYSVKRAASGKGQKAPIIKQYLLIDNVFRSIK